MMGTTEVGLARRLDADIAAGEVDPFVVETEPPRFFTDGEREKRLNLLLHLAQCRDVVLLIGEPGTGKSTVAREFVARAAPTWRICHIRVAAGQAGPSVLAAIVDAFSAVGAVPGIEGPIESLRESLQLLRRSDLVPVLVLDDAHLLPKDALQALAQLLEPRAPDGPPLAVILLADPMIEQTLADPGLEGLRQRVRHRFALRPLDVEETAAYIRFRLSGLGLDGEGLFKPATVKFIHVSSRGIPAKIDELASTVWRSRQDPLYDPRRSADGGVLSSRYRWRLWLALFIAPLIGVLWWRGDLSEPSRDLPAMTDAPAVATVEPPVAAPTQAKGRDEISASNGEQTSAESTTTAETAVMTAPTSVPRSDAPKPHPTAASTPDTVSVPAIAQTGPETMEPTQHQTAATDEGTVAAVPRPVPAPSTRPGPGVSGPVPVAAPPLSARISAPAPVAQDRDAEWLLEQPADQYTLQLMAMEAHKVEAYFAEHPLDRLVRREIERDGRRLMVVSYGAYADAASAASAGRALEAQHPGLRPWVRRFGEIQAEIRLEAGRTRTPPIPAATAGDEAWYRDRNARHYTLQLLAMEAAKVRAFRAAAGQPGDLKIYSFSKENKEMAALTWGDFASREAALAAVPSLRSRFPGVDPWPRSFGSIQRVLGQATPPTAVTEPVDGSP